MEQATLSPEVLEAAKKYLPNLQKLLEKQQKATDKAKEHVAANYPYADAETLVYDAVAKKNKVEVTCIKCGTVHSRYTSDLKQTKGVCPECKKDADKETKAARKELLAKAMQAISEGRI